MGESKFLCEAFYVTACCLGAEWRVMLKKPLLVVTRLHAVTLQLQELVVHEFFSKVDLFQERRGTFWRKKEKLHLCMTCLCFACSYYQLLFPGLQWNL